MTQQPSNPEVVCESCNKVIATADTWDEVYEIAEFEFDAHCHRGDEGSGDWTCDPCYQARMNEFLAEMPIWRAKMRVEAYERELAIDPMRAYLRQKGEL